MLKPENRLESSASKFSGRKEFLEAVCASSALIASSEGGVRLEDILATQRAIESNKYLRSNFKVALINSTIDIMLKKAEEGKSGRSFLYKKLDVAKGDKGVAEAIYLAALYTAEYRGDIDILERATLTKIATRLNVTESSLLDV